MATGCFSSHRSEKHYYTLYANNQKGISDIRLVGTAYVRNLNAESAYDKFQIVVRTSPYELSYRESQVWAVRPNRMISDQIARVLVERRVFDTVSRELGSTRPDIIIGGELHAIEIYDSQDVWFAHLAIGLHAIDFRSGEVLGSYSFDDRKQVRSLDFSTASRALSELLSKAIDEAILSLTEAVRARPEFISPQDTHPQEKDKTPSQTKKPPAPKPLMVPEPRPE